MASNIYETPPRRLSRTQMNVHQGFWRLRIGELPVSYNETSTSITQPFTTPEPETVNGLIQNFIAPGLSATFAKEGHYKFVTNIPTTEDNQFEKTISITMLCDNRYENYWAIDRYMTTVQSGQTNGTPILNMYHPVYGLDKRYRNRLTFIPYIDIHAADDVAQEYMIFRYERCRIAELSDINVKPGAIDVASFNLSIKYELRRLIRLPDPNELMSAICVSTSSDAYN